MPSPIFIFNSIFYVMKLHLPKLLFVAIMATFCSVAYATDTVLKKGESSTYTATTTDVTLSGDDRVGHIDANGALYTAFKATAEG